MEKFQRMTGATTDGFLPVLQVIHVSDPHFGPSKAAIAVTGRQGASTLGTQMGNWLMRHNQGFAGHDANAIFALETILKRIVEKTRNPQHAFRDCPFRLVVTGDLSTWGDEASIKRCMHRFTQLADAVKVGAPPVFLYGNHDVWPGVPGQPKGFPLFVENPDLDAGRSRLRRATGLFPSTWPRLHESHPIPGIGALTLLSVNTVRHGRIENSLGQGHVGPDRYWEGNGGPAQHAVVGDSCSPGIRVVLTHHPIHDPALLARVPYLPIVGGGTLPLPHSALGNPLEVATSFRLPQTGDDPVWRRRVQVVLSGHTHETFPEFGKLDAEAPKGRRNPPLAQDQVQLTAGSACQSAWTASAKPQEWQLLRFSVSRKQSRKQARVVLKIERSVFARSSRTGRYVARLSGARSFEDLQIVVR